MLLLHALQVLDLCCNQITRSGVLAVAKSLATAKAGGAGGPLELLALDENGISEAGIEQLRQLLKVGGLLCMFGAGSGMAPACHAAGREREAAGVTALVCQ